LRDKSVRSNSELIWNLPPARVTSGQRASQLVVSLFLLPDLAVGRPVRIHFILEDAGHGIQFSQFLRGRLILQNAPEAHRIRSSPG
jgi:hypothetical protein